MIDLSTVLVEGYARALARYVTSPDAVGLARAYEIGRAALDEGTTLLELTSTHDDAVDRLIADAADGQTRQIVRHAAAFRTEALAPFEVAQRGYRDATAILSDLSVLEDASDAVVVRDLHGNVSYWNAGARRLYGYTRSEATAADLHTLLATRFPEPHDRILASLRAQGHWSGRLAQTRHDGSTITVESRWSVRHIAGEVTAVLEISSDVTARARAEQAMREMLAAERAAAERLREADELKNTFLQAVSHELRTPLTSILGFAKVLDRRDIELGADRRMLMTRRLTVAAEKLSGLLEDLLDVDRLARGVVRLDPRPVDAADLVTRTVRSVRAPERDVRLDLTPGTYGLDPAKVERIVENLVVNAQRHTPPGTTVTVRLRPTEGGCHLSVEDDGPGIPEVLRPYVFEPFRQGPTARDDPSPGTGIGLALVARLARLHSGRAWVEDSASGGAAFHVDLGSVTCRDGLSTGGQSEHEPGAGT